MLKNEAEPTMRAPGNIGKQLKPRQPEDAGSPLPEHELRGDPRAGGRDILEHGRTLSIQRDQCHRQAHAQARAGAAAAIGEEMGIFGAHPSRMPQPWPTRRIGRLGSYP